MHDHRAFTLLERLDAAGQLTRRRAGAAAAGPAQDRSELRQQLFLPVRAAAQVEHGHPARPEHELRELARLAHAGRAQRFEHLQQHLLDEIVCGRGRPQVTKTIEPNPRPHAAAHFGFGVAIALGDARCARSASLNSTNIAAHST